MAKCATNECLNTVKEGYKYCPDCYARWKAKQPTAPTPSPSAVVPRDTTKWHDDPLIDVLLKMNSNLGNIAQELKTMKRTKETFYDEDLEPERVWGMNTPNNKQLFINEISVKDIMNGDYIFVFNRTWKGTDEYTLYRVIRAKRTFLHDHRYLVIIRHDREGNTQQRRLYYDDNTMVRRLQAKNKELTCGVWEQWSVVFVVRKSVLRSMLMVIKRCIANDVTTCE